MHPIIISPPAAQPVLLMDAKTHLRIDHQDDDAFISSLIEAATRQAEDYTGLALIERTLRQFEDGNAKSIQLYAWPFREIVEVVCYDAEGNPNTLGTEEYFLHRSDLPVLELSIANHKASNGVEIDYKTGFGQTGVDVPANINRAILMLIAHWYEFRGTVTNETRAGFMPDGWSALLAPVRRVKL